MSDKSTKKKVRFSKKNYTCFIERRGRKHAAVSATPSPVVILDDEVKDHPVFTKPILNDPVNSTAQNLTQQLNENPKRDTVINPVTGRTVTRFGSSYWKLLEIVFGLKSDMFAREKDAYKTLYKQKA